MGRVLPLRVGGSQESDGKVACSPENSSVLSMRTLWYSGAGWFIAEESPVKILSWGVSIKFATFGKTVGPKHQLSLIVSRDVVPK